MEIWNCVWVGAAAGVAASWLIRGRNRTTPLPSAVAVGVLGALLGAVAGRFASDLPDRNLAADAVGAALALAAWAGAQKLLPAGSGAEKTSDAG